MNNLLHCFVRNDGSPSLSMAAMIIGSMSNIVLDYVFIFLFHMGIFGAILATGLAPVISLAVLVSYFIHRKNGFPFMKFSLDMKGVLRILSIGVSSLVTELTSGIVLLLFNFIILHLAGNTGVAAFSVITVISLVVVAVYTGLSQGIQPLLSLNHGTGNRQNVKVVWKYAMITMLLLSSIIYSTIFFCAPQLVFIFNNERNAVLQEFAVMGLKLYFLVCPFMGFNILTATYFTSTEHPHPAQIISLLRGFIVLLPVAFLLSSLLKMTGVWCAYPLTECIVALTGAVFYILQKKKKAH